MKIKRKNAHYVVEWINEKGQLCRAPAYTSKELEEMKKQIQAMKNERGN